MATLSLAEWAISRKEPLSKGVMLGIAQEGLVADILNFRSTNALAETGVRYDEVIEPDFIGLDGTISSKTAKGKQLSFGVSELAVHIDIPVALERAGNVVEKPSTRQTMLAIKGAAYKVNDTFVNGDIGSDPYAFDGLNKAVGNLGSAQSVGSTEIDVADNGTSAERQSVFDRLDEGFHAIEGHKPSFGLCNSTFGLKFRTFLRMEGLLGNDNDWSIEDYGFGNARMTNRTASTKPMFAYNQVPFYDIGVKADQTTKVIGDTYTEGGSTASATRVFLVKAGEDDVEGIQFSAPDMREIGMLEAKNVLRHRFTWRLGMALWGPRSIVKVQGISVL